MARPAPLAMMPTSPSRPTYCRPFSWAASLALVADLGGVVVAPLVAELGVVVEGDLGVEGVDLAVGRDDQRVDLGQVGVALGVGGVELEQHRPPRRRWPSGLSLAATTHSRQASSVSPSTGSIQILAMASGFVAATCSISTPPSADSMPRCFLAERSRVKRRVVLLGDVRGVLDPEDVGDVALDVQPEDVAGVRRAPRRRRRRASRRRPCPARPRAPGPSPRPGSRRASAAATRLLHGVDGAARRRPGCRTGRRTACLGIREDPRRAKLVRSADDRPNRRGRSMSAPGGPAAILGGCVPSLRARAQEPAVSPVKQTPARSPRSMVLAVGGIVLGIVLVLVAVRRGHPLAHRVGHGRGEDGRRHLRRRLRRGPGRQHRRRRARCCSPTSRAASATSTSSTSATTRPPAGTPSTPAGPARPATAPLDVGGRPAALPRPLRRHRRARPTGRGLLAYSVTVDRERPGRDRPQGRRRPPAPPTVRRSPEPPTAQVAAARR